MRSHRDAALKGRERGPSQPQRHRAGASRSPPTARSGGDDLGAERRVARTRGPLARQLPDEHAAVRGLHSPIAPRNRRLRCSGAPGGVRTPATTPNLASQIEPGVPDDARVAEGGASYSREETRHGSMRFVNQRPGPRAQPEPGSPAKGTVSLSPPRPRPGRVLRQPLPERARCRLGAPPGLAPIGCLSAS